MQKNIVLFLTVCFTFGLCSLTSAQESDFRFNNWPLVDFEQRSIINPFSGSHFGVDINAKMAEEVKAVAGGKVYWTYSGGAHGIAVGVEHPNGWRTTYLHLSQRLVKKGQEVKANQVLGMAGVTGTGRDSDQTHLHFALISNAKADITQPEQRYVDPLLYGPVISTPTPQPEPDPQSSPIEESAISPNPDPVSILTVDPVNTPAAIQETKQMPIEKTVIVSHHSPVILSEAKNPKIFRPSASRPALERTEGFRMTKARPQSILTSPILNTKALFQKALGESKVTDRKTVVTGNNAHKVPMNELNTTPSKKMDIIVLFWVFVILSGLLANFLLKSYNKPLVYDFLLKAKTLG